MGSEGVVAGTDGVVRLRQWVGPSGCRHHAYSACVRACLLRGHSYALVGGGYYNTASGS